MNTIKAPTLDNVKLYATILITDQNKHNRNFLEGRWEIVSMNKDFKTVQLRKENITTRRDVEEISEIEVEIRK